MIRSAFRISPDWVIMAVLFLLAAGLRIWGIGWSLPYVVHLDEPTIVDAGTHILRTGDPNPHFFDYPSLIIYIQTAVYQLSIWWNLAWGGGPQPLPVSNHIVALAPDLYLWGRGFTALAGAAVVAGTYGLGRAMFGRGAGLVAALFLLTSPFHVRYSHFLTTDIGMGALGLAALAAAWGLATTPTPRRALVTGALVGLCAAAKYNGAYIGLVAGIAWFYGLAARRRRAWPGWLALGVGMLVAAALAFLLANPYVILDWPNWSAGFTLLVPAYQPVPDLWAMAGPYATQVQALWFSEPWLLGFGLVGGALLLADVLSRRGDRGRLGRAAALLAPFPPLYIFAMSNFYATATYTRNLIITLPFLALMGGYCVARLSGELAARLPARWPQAARRPALLAGLAGLLLTLAPGDWLLRFERYMGLPDSRNLAFAWLGEELRAGRRAAVELHPWQTCAPEPGDCAAPDVYTPSQPLTDHPPAWYAAHGYDYVMLLGKEYSAVNPLLWKPRNSEELAPYLALPEALSFAGDSEGQKGPTVHIYRVGPGLAGLNGVVRSGARFGNLAELWGYAHVPLAHASDLYDPAADLPPGPTALYHPGAALGLNLYWRSLESGTAHPGQWLITIHLLDEAGATVAEIETQPVSGNGLRPVSDWYENEFLAGAYNLTLPANLPPGSYHLQMAFYDKASGLTLPVALPSIGSAQSYLDLGTIAVGP